MKIGSPKIIIGETLISEKKKNVHKELSYWGNGGNDLNGGSDGPQSGEEGGGEEEETTMCDFAECDFDECDFN